MPASPLTDERWSGLPLLQCNMDPGRYRIHVDTPVLITRCDVGTSVEVQDEAGAHPVFRQAPLRFDLFSSGSSMDAVSDRPATKSLVVALPPQWLEADVPVHLSARYQFNDVELQRLVWSLSRHHRDGEPLGPAHSSAVSRAIADRIVRLQLAAEARLPERSGLRPEARRLVEALVDASLQEPPSAAALAAHAGMGVNRFVREFKVTFGATPHQYVQQRRLARALDLLRRTDASLTTVALETGFASHAHFSTVFRATFDITPSTYRLAAASLNHKARTPRS
jgi:AraC family transcriptional regulator